MKRVAVKGKPGVSAVSVALTWDGARVPVRVLPPAARKFLGSTTAPSGWRLAGVFAGGGIREIRICWVPRLRGGNDVLCAPFVATGGRRVAFRATKAQRFADVLGIVYKR